jgi:hypothetical protein
MSRARQAREEMQPRGVVWQIRHSWGQKQSED